MFWWWCFCRVLHFVLTDLCHQQASISVATSIHKHQTIRMFLCVSVLVCLCGCVLEEEEDDEGEKKSELVLQMDKREKKRSEM